MSKRFFTVAAMKISVRRTMPLVSVITASNMRRPPMNESTIVMLKKKQATEGEDLSSEDFRKVLRFLFSAKGTRQIRGVFIFAN